MLSSGIMRDPKTIIAAAPPGGGFVYSAFSDLEFSQVSISDSFQRHVPGVNLIGWGKVGSSLTQRLGVR